MLPYIAADATLKKNYVTFLKELSPRFSGDICTDYATRLSLCVDNSIYQVIPQAVLFPKTTSDIASVFHLAHQDRFHDVQFCPRGGGTSTNGQSLSAGILIDCSRYMRSILEINLHEKWVRVQPGVVLDQLNDTLRPNGFSFAPEISPSNRATIGGMINTDACGIGSKILGRTSDHVIDLTCVLANGQIIQTENNSALYSEIKNLLTPHTALINDKFTSAPRTLNGYNLKKTNDKNLNYLFSGSEGTLAVISECKLKLTPLPKYKKLLILKYRTFDDALRAVELTENFKPLAVEAIDEKLVDLARSDPIYFALKDFIDTPEELTRAVNLVEFVSSDEAELFKNIEDFCVALDTNKNLPGHAIGYYVAKDAKEAKIIWELRKKSVGLISKKTDGTRRPIPFIEDTAVPPEKLADYISEFRALLDSYNLTYGMYGHVDAGCVHVRPALDMKILADEKLMQELTYKVVTLVEKYRGVLWGEHGQGYRSQFGEHFFGEELYNVVRKIKTLFDPYNQLNPGKIAVSHTSNTSQKLVQLDGPFRGLQDQQISESLQKEFPNVINCNGNGACFNYATADVMCPSFKVTQNRIHSPKGRATVMREWLRLLSSVLPERSLVMPAKAGIQSRKVLHWLKASTPPKNKTPDFSHEVYQAMSGCLSCKACANQCPLNVDVPEFKSKFLFMYHQRYKRLFRDYLIANLEKLVVLQSRLPRLNNWILNRKFIQFIFKKIFKLVDLPLVSTKSLKKEFQKRNLVRMSISALLPKDRGALNSFFTNKRSTLLGRRDQLSNFSQSRDPYNFNQSPETLDSKSIILLQDAFTSYYNPTILLQTYDFLTHLGFTVYIAPYFESGKPQHVKGFLKQFHRTVNINNKCLNQLAELNIPIIGIDPSVTLTYRDEYQKILGDKKYHIFLLQEWLSQQLDFIKSSKNAASNDKPTKLPETPFQKNTSFYLLAHCTEKTLCIESEKQWRMIFNTFGMELISLSAGCCGMAGSYGHEAEHLTNSRSLFNMDWQKWINEHFTQILATGYSCRSQANRFAHVKLRHPIQVLGEQIAHRGSHC